MNKAARFLAGLKKEVLNHPVMSHPFWARFRQGPLTMKQCRTFALNYYQHVRLTRLYDAAVLARAPIEGIQAALASILCDEYGNGDMEQTHPAQFRRLLQALDLTPADWDHAALFPELTIYSDIHYRLCTDYPVWVGLGVVGVAMELPIPVLYQHLIEGLATAGVKKEALEFFVEHGPTDVRHARLLLDSMVPHLGREEDQEAMRLGALRSMDARTILMDGLSKIVWGAR